MTQALGLRLFISSKEASIHLIRIKFNPRMMEENDLIKKCISVDKDKRPELDEIMKELV